jgi:heme/copper-type cytochrome/quinol oxidase subunit 3
MAINLSDKTRKNIQLWGYIFAWFIAMPFAMFPSIFDGDFNFLNNNDPSVFAIPFAMVAIIYLWDTAFTMARNKRGLNSVKSYDFLVWILILLSLGIIFVVLFITFYETAWIRYCFLVACWIVISALKYFSVVCSESISSQSVEYVNVIVPVNS